MANLPPNHVANLPEDNPEEQPELAPEPDHLNMFAPHQIPQPDGNMNGWILEDDEEEEEEEEDPEMEEEMEEENNDDDDAEVINPYEEADPLQPPPPDSDTESEDTAVAPTPDDHEQEDDAATVGTITRVPYSVRPFSGTVYVGTGPSRQVFAPGPTARDVNTLHRQVKGLSQQMFDRANTEHSNLKRLSVMDKYLAEFDSDLRGQIKGQHGTSWKKEKCAHWKIKFEMAYLRFISALHPFRHYRKRPYVAPTAPVAPALAQDRATRGNTNGAGGSGGNIEGNAQGQGGAPPARECTYSSFMKCNPTSFHGNEGAVELCRWFEKTESVFSISECAERNKVKFAAATLQGRALTWWNSQVATLGLEVVNAKSWNDMKIMNERGVLSPEEIQRMN
ncbi:hypothetical protein Tco_0628328 [Tanacetum coccineum]|uniref:Retrotransposon gag domain-containing protein n=1 Tax=Tanacetum coccineum TaxID=301880 RepID=A0ABQ4WQ13_9ASTR